MSIVESAGNAFKEIGGIYGGVIAIFAMLEFMWIVYSGASVHFGMNKSTRLLKYMRDRLISNRNISKKLLSDNSIFANFIIEVNLAKIQNRRRLEIEGGWVVSANATAHRVFGVPPDSEELIGLGGEQLLSRIRAWMDPEDFYFLVEDQHRVYDDLLNSKHCRAKVPIKFNDAHPFAEFRYSMLLPIVVGYGTVEREDKTSRLLHVTYLDLREVAPIANKYMGAEGNGR